MVGVRIDIYWSPTFHDCPLDYHFARQDDNGEWSEKPSWKGKVRKIGEKGNNAPDLSKYGPKLEKVLILSR